MSLETTNSIHSTWIEIPDPFSLALEVSRRFSSIFFRNMREYYLNLYWENTLDSFVETKKKCLPGTLDHLSWDEKWMVHSRIVYYSTIPFTAEKRDGSSFTAKTMNNLIVDSGDRLMQLIFSQNSSASLPPGQKLMQVTEYIYENGKTVARKFEEYL